MSSISTSTGEGSSRSRRRPDSMRCQTRAGGFRLGVRFVICYLFTQLSAGVKKLGAFDYELPSEGHI